MRFLLLLLLAGCPGTTTKPTPATGAEEEAPTETPEDTPPPTYDTTSAELVTAAGWTTGLARFGGYSMAAAPGGLYIADPVTDGTHAAVYRLPWGTTAPIIEDGADLLLMLGYLGPDKMGYSGGKLAIADADQTTSVEHAGIGYSLDEPTESGNIEDAGGLAIAGTVEKGYAAHILWFDADGDGVDDDVAATQGTYGETHAGELGIFLDAPESGSLTFDDADLLLPACEDIGGVNINYGPVDLTVDPDGLLWAACPSNARQFGTIEGWTLPLDSAGPVVQIPDVSGFSVVADPAGGVWAGVEGDGLVLRADQDGAISYYSGDDARYYGAAPMTLLTEGGQTLLAVGALSKSADGSSFVALCDLTEGSDAGCTVYEPTEAVPCIGAVQGLIEIGGVVWLSSSGWLYGSGDGCGVQVWRLDAE